MRVSPTQNTIKYPIVALKSKNPSIAFKGNINEDVFSNREDNDSLKKIFDTPDSASAGMQYFNNFLALSKTKKNSNSQGRFDFENILNNLKMAESIDENWVRKNIILFEKLYGIDSSEGVDSNLLAFYRNDLNRNKKSIIVQLENEYLKDKLNFLNTKIPQIKEWNENNIKDLNISIIKQQMISPVYVLSKSIKNQQKPSVISLQNKMNSNVFEMPNVGVDDFIQTFDKSLDEAKHSQNAKKNIIVLNNLYKYINQNKENFDSFTKNLANLVNDNKNSVSSTIILDLESFDNNTDYSQEKKTTLNEIPFYENEKRELIEKLVSASFNTSLNAHTPSCVILEGNSQKDVASLISSISGEALPEIQTVKNDINVHDFADILNEHLKKTKTNNQKPIIYIPDFYRYTAFDENNRKLINDIIKDKRAVIVLTSSKHSRVEKTIEDKNLLNISLPKLSEIQLVKILKDYTDNVDDFINDKINKGFDISPIKIDIPYEAIIKVMQCQNKDLGFSDLKNIVDQSKNNYIKNPEKSFENHLFEIITNDTKDRL